MALPSKEAKVSGKTKRPVPPSNTPEAKYYSPDSMRIDDFDLSSPSFYRQHDDVNTLKIEGLVGASATKTAVYKSKHLDVSVFRELNESLRVIEEKFHAGMYDAQAMPLVEAFLDEVEVLAQIQVERDAVNDCRINDIKTANAAAYKAVYSARTDRERGIETARTLSVDAMLPDFDVLELKAEEKSRKRMERLTAKKARGEQREKTTGQRKLALAEGWSEKKRLATEAARQKREDRETKKARKRAQRLERKTERENHRKEMIEQKRQTKLEEHLGKKQLAQIKAQNKIDELQMASAAQKADSLVKQAQADAEIERAKALLQSARADREAARLEEEKAKDALRAFAGSSDLKETSIEHLAESPQNSEGEDAISTAIANDPSEIPSSNPKAPLNEETASVAKEENDTPSKKNERSGIE